MVINLFIKLFLIFKCDNYGCKVKFSINGYDYLIVLIVVIYDSCELWVLWLKF